MIYINDHLRIKILDDRNLQIEEYRAGAGKSEKKGATRWYSCGYYGDLKSALLGALKKQLFDSVENELTIKDVIERIDTARAEIVNAIERGNGAD